MESHFLSLSLPAHRVIKPSCGAAAVAAAARPRARSERSSRIAIYTAAARTLRVARRRSSTPSSYLLLLLLLTLGRERDRKKGVVGIYSIYAGARARARFLPIHRPRSRDCAPRPLSPSRYTLPLLSFSPRQTTISRSLCVCATAVPIYIHSGLVLARD